MNRLWLVLLLVLSCPVTSPAENNLIEQMEKAEASIVTVRTVYQRPMKVDHHLILASYERHGAGVIIDPTGIIVTNTHIVINAPHILITLSNGKTYEAGVLVVGEGDFTLLKINAPTKLRAIPWAESSQTRIGERIMTYGSSDMNSQSMLGGNVIGLIQSNATGAVELLELNLNLYQGDSGGPILDEQGHLLGLVMGKDKSEDRRSFAIASDKIRQEYLKYKQKMQ
jgi:S1-C subfamily serine protease